MDKLHTRYVESIALAAKDQGADNEVVVNSHEHLAHSGLQVLGSSSRDAATSNYRRGATICVGSSYQSNKGKDGGNPVRSYFCPLTFVGFPSSDIRPEHRAPSVPALIGIAPQVQPSTPAWRLTLKSSYDVFCHIVAFLFKLPFVCAYTSIPLPSSSALCLSCY